MPDEQTSNKSLSWLAPGNVIQGRYQIEEHLALGSFGGVYLARDLNLSQRQVAIKVNRTTPEFNLSIRSFDREASVLASLRHPNIIDVTDFGNVGDATFIVMEYVPGKTLDDLIRSFENGYSIPHTFAITTQISDALDYIHEEGIIHGNLKPSKVMLSERQSSRPGGTPWVKLLGFGLSLPTDTLTSTIAGTPVYMAPEQFTSNRLTPASDIYALGLIVYQMVTGSLPFKGSSMASLLMAKLNEPVMPPRYLREELPPAASLAILQALDPHPENRFASAGDFSRALTSSLRLASQIVGSAESGVSERMAISVTSSVPGTYVGSTPTLEDSLAVFVEEPKPPLLTRAAQTMQRKLAALKSEWSLWQQRRAKARFDKDIYQDLQAASLEELAEVTGKIAWTKDSPFELVADLQRVLPRFDQASQYVRQYLSHANIYGKNQALEDALNEISNLQRSRRRAEGDASALLLKTANEWFAILSAEQRKIKYEAKTATALPNPFFFGNAVTETENNVFTGRKDLVQRLSDSILNAEQPPTLLLRGARRMGKTSVLNQLPRLLGPDFAPATVDCQNPATVSEQAALLRYLSRAMSEGLRRRWVQIDALALPDFQYGEPFALFDEWLEEVEKKLPKGMRVLLCLDEYERLQEALDAGWGAALLDALRHILQHRPRFVLLFSGARAFHELGPAWTGRFISARMLRVSFLQRDEVLPLLTKPVPEFNLEYRDGALDALIDATNGQPFLTQAVAFELVEFLNQQQRKYALPDDIREALTRALDSGAAYFHNVWTDAAKDGQAILRAVAQDAPPPDLPRAARWLREHDVLNDAGQFAVPLVREWVAHYAPLAE